MRIIDTLVIEEKDIKVEAVIMQIGNDWLITISGGTAPHLGAVTIGNHKERKDVALEGHKELAVTQRMFLRLSRICKDNLLITGGIHIDHITREQITLVMELCDSLTEMIAGVLVNDPCNKR